MKNIFSLFSFKRKSPSSSPNTSPTTSPTLSPITSPVLSGHKSTSIYSFQLDTDTPSLSDVLGGGSSTTMFGAPLSLDGAVDWFTPSSGAKDASSSTNTSTFHHFQQLGEEVKIHIFSFLSFRDILSLSVCSRDMYRYSHDRILWQTIFERSGWPLSREIKLNKNFNLMRYYYDKANISSNDTICWSSITNSHGRIPTKRYKHTAIPYKNYIVLIGGQETNAKRFGEIIYYNTKTNTFETHTVKGDQIPNFSRHTSRVIDKKVYLFGGYNGAGTYYNLAIYNLEKRRWSNVPMSAMTGDIPPPRSNLTSAVVGTDFYIFSGNNTADNGQYTILDDFYRLDTNTLHWTRIEASGDVPTGRGGHCMEVIDNKIYLFGGGAWNPSGGWASRFNDIHVYNPVTNHWTHPQLNGVSPATSTFPASFVYGRFLVLFGGGCHRTNRVTNHLYALDTDSMSWIKLSIPSSVDELRPRDMSTSTVINNQVYIYGGFSGGAIDYFDKLTFNFTPATAQSC
ncbi:hypothetical protein SAMD00019534_003980 [Acytostelium subglobosum LB1]|uniref:hypothetical protein n=1 Tax=Acytostelium subglobosum LB1 TaxID=1410327 RepID=UPI000644B7A4|nr:hypothetical protein SAMD00019534_003980 [Acytostelium subglobosum LB1]GAM17223.1 hypothetical protein SAMD00019534_003980 [Acytostelium subglobosum LB1]|eukprot:XP_012759285.1 hypothetical protein SAMD00019534_003980 [Acytostelium subglobosum LB1]